ncbi:transglycosylase [Rheinheimera mesophila]|uniref:Transglycosylase n=1 Tax=Rheinheimera mesophila TaxID=1547515 RepID=A0A3P3QNM9_9GAMM|nr:transglycosylase SLT domain-containing protein [Rheinheimera mesophila]KKL01402.1 transglycosylase [Rheinheimera mesophila]RRJ22836.1 transglycosylase [Rheinheimera mesophila]
MPSTFFSFSLIALLSATATAGSFSHSKNMDYAAWSEHNRDGSWTRITEQAVAQSPLVSLVPADVQNFCPRYASLARQQRSQFWVALFSAMAKPESNFQPQSFYQEKFKDGKGRRVISRGLLQISHESANQPRYGCDIKHPHSLHDPRVNLSCGVKIMSKWVKTDGVISQPRWSNAPKGGARYWSTLRPQRGKVQQIADFTRQLSFCDPYAHQREKQKLRTAI